MSDYVIDRPAIRVNQRFGHFYVVKFTANELLRIAYPEHLRRKNGVLVGNQRLINKDRAHAINDYIGSANCAFPNSIILAANFRKDDDGALCEDDDYCWTVKKNGNSESYNLVVPKIEPMAVIIDGQHRLEGFREAGDEARNMELICSVYLDLPSSLQAFLFATINSTQKPVPKSLAYELFGFDLTKEPPETWSPDKLAISICRKLNDDEKSPFFGHIKPGATSDDSVKDPSEEEEEKVYRWKFRLHA
jgi:DNA phosphorothioation-associated DGQHR protein 1